MIDLLNETTGQERDHLLIQLMTTLATLRVLFEVGGEYPGSELRKAMRQILGLPPMPPPEPAPELRPEQIQ